MAIRAMSLAKVIGGSSSETITVPEGAGPQAFLAGEVLIESSSTAVRGATAPADGTVLGIAAHAASGTTAEDVEIYPALPNYVFEVSVDDGTGTLALLATHLLNDYALTLSTNIWYLDTGGTGDCRVIELVDPVGTVTGRVRCVFLSALSAFATA